MNTASQVKKLTDGVDIKSLTGFCVDSIFYIEQS